jgi:hypothetical protein
VVAAAGAPRLRVASYLDVSLPADDEELARYHALEREFGSQRVAVLALGCDAPRPCADVFDPVLLGLVREITDAARGTVLEVRSLPTASVLAGGPAVAAHQFAKPLPTPSRSPASRRYPARLASRPASSCWPSRASKASRCSV